MKPNILSLHLMNIKTQNKNNISYNGWVYKIVLMFYTPCYKSVKIKRYESINKIFTKSR